LRSEVITRRLLSSASLYYVLRRRRYANTGAKKEIAAGRTRFYRDVWDEAVLAAGGGTVTELDGAVLEIRCGDVVLRTRTNLTSLDDPLTVSVAENKPLVYRLLGERDIPVPRHRSCSADDLRSAWAFAVSLGRPCIVKPARNTSGAIGITSAIGTRYEMARALAYAGAFDDELSIEEHVEGGVYRLLYLDGELLDAVLRLPPTVRGDGKASIERLIAVENERRLQGGMEVSQSLLKVDLELRLALRRQGCSLRSVPRAGQVVRLKNIVNDNCRDDNESAVGRLCPEVVAAGVKAAAAVGARLAGVDLITPDPAVPLDVAGGVVIEVNTAPGYYYHYMKRDGRVPVASLLLQRLVRAAP